MTSEEVVETSVTNNSSSPQNSTQPDDQLSSRYINTGVKLCPIMQMYIQISNRNPKIVWKVQSRNQANRDSRDVVRVFSKAGIRITGVHIKTLAE